MHRRRGSVRPESHAADVLRRATSADSAASMETADSADWALVSNLENGSLWSPFGDPIEPFLASYKESGKNLDLGSKGSGAQKRGL